MFSAGSEESIDNIYKLPLGVVYLQVHAYIIGYLRGQMPTMMGKEKVQKKLINGETR